LQEDKQAKKINRPPILKIYQNEESYLSMREMKDPITLGSSFSIWVKLGADLLWEGNGSVKKYSQ